MSGQSTPGQPAVPRRASRHRWLIPSALLAIAAGLGTIGFNAWRRHALSTRVLAALPALPPQGSLPPQLAERLARASALARTPDHALEGAVELGRLYHASGFDREAEACWRLLHAEQPREARWCYYLAALRRNASDYAGASDWLEQTLRLAPDYAPAWLALAELQFKTGQTERAAEAYARRLALLPRDPYARLGQARVALQNNDRAKARLLIEQLVKESPMFSTGHNLYAEMLAADGDEAGATRQRMLGRETGRFYDAEDPWLDSLQAWCFNYDRLCVLGTIAFQTGRGDSGKSCFERALELRPDLLSAYQNLAALYLQKNTPAKAREILEQGLRRTPTVTPPALYYVNLSRACREMKLPEDAVRVAQEGLARRGNDYELLEALGVALGDAGRRREAVDTLRSAVALGPNDANVNYNLALALIITGNLDEAITALHRSLVLQPTFPSSLLLLAQIEMDSGRWASAAEYLRPLREAHLEMPQVRRELVDWAAGAGAAAEKEKDFAAAERYYRDGLDVEPSHPGLQLALGTLCLIHGRFADAIAPLEAYHRLQPQNAQAFLYLGQAYAAVGRLADARRILTEGVQTAGRTGNSTTMKYCQELLQQLPGG